MRTKFLLHTCCAPCSIVIIDELKDKFDLTVFFYNSNIFPEAEYLRRKAEVVKICNEWRVPMIDMDHMPRDWDACVSGLENEPEGGLRCLACFGLRLEKTADYAGKNDFAYFGTSLTSGRNKKAAIIHPIGLKLAKKNGLQFYEMDWKKDGRQEKGRRMVEERGIYRQSYCGCKYSMQLRDLS